MKSFESTRDFLARNLLRGLILGVALSACNKDDSPTTPAPMQKKPKPSPPQPPVPQPAPPPAPFQAPAASQPQPMPQAQPAPPPPASPTPRPLAPPQAKANLRDADGRRLLSLDTIEMLDASNRKSCEILNWNYSHISEIITTDSGVYIGKSATPQASFLDGRDLSEIGSHTYARVYRENHVQAWYSDAKLTEWKHLFARDFLTTIKEGDEYKIYFHEYHFNSRNFAQVNGKTLDTYYLRGECAFMTHKADFDALLSYLLYLDDNLDLSPDAKQIVANKVVLPDFKLQRERFGLGIHADAGCTLGNFAPPRTLGNVALLGNDTKPWMLESDNKLNDLDQDDDYKNEDASGLTFRLYVAPETDVQNNPSFEIKRVDKYSADEEGALSILRFTIGPGSIDEANATALRMTGNGCIGWMENHWGSQSWTNFRNLALYLTGKYPIGMFLNH